MNKRIQSAWHKLTQAQANIWLTAVIVILFVTAVTVLNMLNLEYSDTQARSLAGSTTSTNYDGTIGSPNFGGTPSAKLVAEPSSVVLGKNIYLIATFDNVSGCTVSGRTIETPFALTDFDSGAKLVYGTAPTTNPNEVYIYTLSCVKPDGTNIESQAFVTFIDTNQDPQAFLSGQQVSITREPLGAPVTGGTLQITKGNGVKLERICLNAQSGYITNRDGKILAGSKTATPSSTTYVLHDDQGASTVRGINTDKTYTANCFSKVNYTGKKATAELQVDVQ
jgi:hypothetical protein